MNPPFFLAPIFTIARFTLQEALRERLIRASVAMIGLGWIVSLFLDELLLTGNAESRAAILGFFFRLGSVFLVSVLVTFAVARELHNRGMDLMLAMPFPRSVTLLGKLLGFFGAAALLAGVSGLALLPLVSWQAVGWWSLILACELWIMAAFAVVVTLAIQQAPLALSLTAGFYLLARSMGAVLLIARQAQETTAHWSSQAIQLLLAGIAGALPALDRFTATALLVQGDGSFAGIWPILGETGIFLLLLTAVGLFDLYKKEF
ncbi:MAG: ABC transporter permease [Magnetococcales bacterium]|nr:ABC transporter permease [Magnetococcales bacterium]